MAYEKISKMNSLPNLFTFPIYDGQARLAVKDVPVLIRDTVGGDRQKYLERSRSYLFSPSSKERTYILLPTQNFPSGVGARKTIDFKTTELTSWYVYYLDSIFPQSTLSNSFLLTGSVKNDYLFTPEDIRKAGFEAELFALAPWQPKDPNKRTRLRKDYKAASG